MQKDKISLLVSCLIGFAFSANYTNHAPISELLMQVFQFNKAQAGLLTTGIFISHACMQIPGGILADKYGGKKVVAFAMIIVCLGNVGITFSTSYQSLLFWKVFVGFGTGMSFIGTAKFIAQTISKERLHVYQGYYGASVLLGSGFVIFGIPRIVEHYQNWTYGFNSTAFIALIASITWYLFAPTSFVSSKPQTSLKQLLKDKRLWQLGTVQMASFGLSIVIGSWVTTVLKQSGHFNHKLTISFIASLVLLLGILSRPLGGKLKKNYTNKQIILSSLGMNAFACFMLAFFHVHYIIPIISVIILGIFCGLPYSALFNRATEIFPERAGAAMGLVNMMGILMILVGAPFVGMIKEVTNQYFSAFVTLGVFVMLVLGLQIIAFKKSYTQ